MSAASTTRPDFHTLMSEVRAWTARIGQPLLPWIHEAIEDRLRWEQKQPRCNRCGSTDMQYGWDDFPTGVDAPDGGIEWRHQEYYECMRCGGRQDL